MFYIETLREMQGFKHISLVEYQLLQQFLIHALLIPHYLSINMINKRLEV